MMGDWRKRKRLYEALNLLKSTLQTVRMPRWNLLQALRARIKANGSSMVEGAELEAINFLGDYYLAGEYEARLGNQGSHKGEIFLMRPGENFGFYLPFTAILNGE